MVVVLKNMSDVALSNIPIQATHVQSAHLVEEAVADTLGVVVVVAVVVVVEDQSAHEAVAAGDAVAATAKAATMKDFILIIWFAG